MSTSELSSRAQFEAWKRRNQYIIKRFNVRQRIKKGRKPYKLRYVDVRPITLGGCGVRAGIKIHMGDSLQTVPCPNCISKGMRQGLQRQASRSQIVFPYRQHAAQDILAENKIDQRRSQKK